MRFAVEAAPDQWATIDLLEQCHLGLADRHEGSLSGNQPVQTELRLDPNVAAELDELPADVTAIAAAPAGSPLRENTSWLPVGGHRAGRPAAGDGGARRGAHRVRHRVGRRPS